MTNDEQTPPAASERRELTTMDPEHIRAIAHPVRLAILELLDDVGEATATQCAQHTGESVANCSFHLRTLAKYGFIEPAERRGRERPWRVTANRRTFTADSGDAAAVRAVAELGAVTARRETERFITFLRSREARAELGEVTRSVTITKDSFWATPDEAAEYIDELVSLSERFTGRSADPSLRPEGARLMRVFATVNPDPDVPAATTATDPQES